MINLLPADGVVDYYGQVLAPAEAARYLDRLLEHIDWRNDEAVIFGRHIITKRKVAWYGDSDYTYAYSNIIRQALPWTQDLLDLKTMTERLTGATYNSCLLNLYHDGDEGMAWHSDDEKELSPDGAIASLSFGAERRFLLRHKKTREQVEVLLASGSLLVMRGTTQTHWLHSLPKMKKVRAPRVNLTFRLITRHRTT